MVMPPDLVSHAAVLAHLARTDLAHRQDADAVASAEAVLTALRKKGVLPLTDSTWSISPNATSTPILTWLPSGSDADSHAPSRRPG